MTRASKLRHFFLALIASGITIAAVGTAHAGDLSCNNSSGLSWLGCKAMVGTILVVGGTVVAMDEVTNAIVPKTDVQVELPDGTLLAGKVSHKALSGRKLVDGKPLRLNCRVATEQVNPEGYQYGYCKLKFPQLTPQPKSLDYSVRTGEQPSWSVGANAQGDVQPALLSLERPLRWVDGKGL